MPEESRPFASAEEAILSLPEEFWIGYDIDTDEEAWEKVVRSKLLEEFRYQDEVNLADGFEGSLDKPSRIVMLDKTMGGIFVESETDPLITFSTTEVIPNLK